MTAQKDTTPVRFDYPLVPWREECERPVAARQQAAEAERSRIAALAEQNPEQWDAARVARCLAEVVTRHNWVCIARTRKGTGSRHIAIQTQKCEGCGRMSSGECGIVPGMTI